jgi:hypothetical protein
MVTRQDILGHSVLFFVILGSLESTDILISLCFCWLAHDFGINLILVTLDVLHSAGALICQSDGYTSGSIDLSQCVAKAALYSGTQITMNLLLH